MLWTPTVITECGNSKIYLLLKCQKPVLQTSFFKLSVTEKKNRQVYLHFYHLSSETGEYKGQDHGPFHVY